MEFRDKLGDEYAVVFCPDCGSCQEVREYVKVVICDNCFIRFKAAD